MQSFSDGLLEVSRVHYRAGEGGSGQQEGSCIAGQGPGSIIPTLGLRPAEK